MDEHTVVDPYDGILLDTKKEQRQYTQSMDESPKHCGKRKNSGMKDYRVYRQVVAQDKR